MKNQNEDIFEPPIPVVPKGWDVLPFELAADVVSDKSKRVKQRDYLPTGKLAVIDQGQDFVGGYTDDQGMAFEGELPVILFGDHTRSIKYVDRPFAVGADGVKILKPAVGFDPKYLFYLLRSLRIPSRGYSRHFQFLRKFHFPRAPEEEQKRIVAEIEKQFSRLDEAVANLKRVKANLKRYKAAVLKAAVEGRLVETEAELARREGRSYETGEQLLQRILETRRSQWQGKGKYKEPVAPETTDLPELPEGWVWATADQVMTLITDGEHITPQRSDSGVLLLSARNVLNGRMDLSEVDFISDEEHKRLCRRLSIAEGDVLLSCSGSVGRSCVVPQAMKFSLVRSVAVLRPAIVSSDFVCYQIQSPWLQSQIKSKQTQTAQANIFQGKIRQLVFALPPTAEQDRIASETAHRLSVLGEIEAQVDANLKRAQGLRQAILHSAFSPSHQYE